MMSDPKITWTETPPDPKVNTIRVGCGHCDFTRVVLGRAEGRRTIYLHNQKEHNGNR